MFASNMFAAWLLLAPLANCFDFSAPTPGTILNLSAASIDIAWRLAADTGIPKVDLYFVGLSDSGSELSYNIATNLSFSDGQYAWNPANTSESLQSTDITLTKGKDHYFRADQHYNNSGTVQSQISGDYSVMGYPSIGAAGSLQLQLGAILLVLASLSMAFGI